MFKAFINKNLFLIVATLTSCQNTIKDKLIDTIDQQCGKNIKSGCVISLKNVTNFKWARMYVFGAWTTSDSIQSQLKMKYQGDDVLDDYSRMIFTNGNSIIYEEDFESFSHWGNSSVINLDQINESISQSSPKYFSPLTTVFSVEKNIDTNTCKTCYVFTLTPKAIRQL